MREVRAAEKGNFTKENKNERKNSVREAITRERWDKNVIRKLQGTDVILDQGESIYRIRIYLILCHSNQSLKSRLLTRSSIPVSSSEKSVEPSS